ncbi:MAG: hypothetical protein LWY06_05290, partial [Firmicutes bacterium]|nr:hypothetical protein [Bacillota bacterium]
MSQIRKSGSRLLKTGINIYTMGFFVVLIMLSAGGFPANAVEISKGGRILIKKTDFPENAEMKSVSISPDSNEVAVATKKSVYIISLSKSGGFHRIYDEGSDIRQISYSNTGKFLSVSDGKKSGYYDFSGKRMIVFPIDYYYDGPSGLYFSDLDTYLIVAATTKDVGHEILLIKTSDGKIYNRFFHLIPRHISCIEKKKMLVTLGRKDLSVYNIEKLGKPVFQRKFSKYFSNLPPFHNNLSLNRVLT